MIQNLIVKTIFGKVWTQCELWPPCRKRQLFSIFLVAPHRAPKQHNPFVFCSSVNRCGAQRKQIFTITRLAWRLALTLSWSFAINLRRRHLSFLFNLVVVFSWLLTHRFFLSLNCLKHLSNITGCSRLAPSEEWWFSRWREFLVLTPTEFALLNVLRDICVYERVCP